MLGKLAGNRDLAVEAADHLAVGNQLGPEHLQGDHDAIETVRAGP